MASAAADAAAAADADEESIAAREGIAALIIHRYTKRRREYMKQEEEKLGRTREEINAWHNERIRSLIPILEPHMEVTVCNQIPPYVSLHLRWTDPSTNRAWYARITYQPALFEPEEDIPGHRAARVPARCFMRGIMVLPLHDVFNDNFKMVYPDDSPEQLLQTVKEGILEMGDADCRGYIW